MTNRKQLGRRSLPSSLPKATPTPQMESLHNNVTVTPLELAAIKVRACLYAMNCYTHHLVSHEEEGTPHGGGRSTMLPRPCGPLTGLHEDAHSSCPTDGYQAFLWGSFFDCDRALYCYSYCYHHYYHCKVGTYRLKLTMPWRPDHAVTPSPFGIIHDALLPSSPSSSSTTHDTTHDNNYHYNCSLRLVFALQAQPKPSPSGILPSTPPTSGLEVEPRFVTKSRWFSYEVTKTHADGSFDVEFEDGDQERRVAGDLLASASAGLIAAGEKMMV